MTDDPATDDDRPDSPTGGQFDDFEIDRRTLLLGVPALGVASAGCYAVLNGGSPPGGPADGSDATPTETPFGYGGTRADTATSTDDGDESTPTESATTAAGDPPTSTATATPTQTQQSGGGSGGGGTETPGDYGIQGYGEYGYGGVFP